MPRPRTDDEFLDFCYRTILGRSPDEAGRRQFLASLKGGGTSREEILLMFLESEEFQGRAPAGLECFPPGHFYSAVPSLEDRDRVRRTTRGAPEGIDVHDEEQVRLFSAVAAYQGDCPFPEEKTSAFRYFFANPSFSYADALVLFGLLRHLRPARIVEVGSGYSSCAMLDTNDRFFEGRIDLTFVDPFPDLLRSLMRHEDVRHRLLARPVQDVDPDVFRSLRAGDILFIGSSHVSKAGSDVNALFFDVLPAIAPGVWVHLHDVFWPFEYPLPWIEEGRAWNEAYLLRAFLAYNRCFSIALFPSYLASRHPSLVRDLMPLALRNVGGSIWLRRDA